MLESWVRDYGTLSGAAAAHPEAEPLQGRGRVHVVPAPVGGGRWVVRHYRRGGRVASRLGDLYLRLGVPRPVREYRLGLALEAAGVPTPVHVGAAVYPAGVWYRGDLVTRYVEGSRDLAEVLFGGSDGAGAPAMRASGRLVRRLHEVGVDHPDLNLKNILLAGPASGPEALILDLDRARLRRHLGPRRRDRMLERFWRSARKWERKTGRVLDPWLKETFVAGYGE